MKSLFKSVLIVLCLFVLFSSIFQGNDVSSSPSINQEITIFEENIQNGNLIENGTILEEDYSVLEGNLFGNLGYILCNFFISLVTGFIKLIVEIINKII